MLIFFIETGKEGTLSSSSLINIGEEATTPPDSKITFPGKNTFSTTSVCTQLDPRVLYSYNPLYIIAEP